MAKKIGVILSGCGVFDGAEIHESVLTLLALDRQGAEAVVCAPDTPQMHVVDHRSGKVEEGASRNVLVESARIARGAIRDIATVKADELDGLVLPGGYGAAKNLCDFAVAGPSCTAHPEVARLVCEVHAQRKPVAALCIAPAVVARVLGAQKPKLTIGTDEATAKGLEAMGATHVPCAVTELTVDRERKLVSTPAYMLGKRISEVAEGIDKAVGAVVGMA
ncbi:MAG TPA: isoprenoid biosynthesis glyoxalase ElbB [Vicinamibacteria bacterium]|nr:isoprenoid biosynthesis glyoxalase ElbB [Vicinamibacteria bacterium]